MAFRQSLDGTTTNTVDVGIALYGSETGALPSNEVKIKASDGAATDYFGIYVAVGSGRIVVGAYNDADNGATSGSAYIYDLDGTQLAKIKPSDGAAGDQFGRKVAVGSGRIVVGSYQDDDNGASSGSAYIFDLNGNQIAKIKASDAASTDYFGVTLAVGCGRIVVGSFYDDDNGSNSGSVYMFDLNGTQLAKIKASDGAASDYFGYNVAIGSGRIVVGAYGDDDKGSSSGSAYIFDLNGTQIAKITASDGAASDYFGYAIGVGCGRIVIGSYLDDDLGYSTGSAYIFDLNGTQLAKIKPSDVASGDRFGISVAVGCNRIVVGSYYDDDNGSNSGSAYIFDLNGNELAKIKPSDGASSDYFGISVAVGSGRIVVGSYYDDDLGSASGSAYIWSTPDVITPYDVQDWERG